MAAQKARMGIASIPWRSGPRLLLEPDPGISQPPGPFVIAAESSVTGQALEWATHTHTAHELLWVRNGLMSFRVGQKMWALPSDVGMWVPAGIPHAGHVSAGAQFQASFFAPGHAVDVPLEPVAISISPLLHELLRHLANPGLAAADRAHAEQVVFDVLAPSEHASFLSIPSDPRIAGIARHLFDHPEDQRTLAQWAQSSAVSAKTLARAFVAATGQTFAQWRMRLRIHVALTLLALDYPVAEVAEEVGYDTASAFIAAFRQVMGVTPGRHQKEQMSV